jgi:hypothetical protein
MEQFHTTQAEGASVTLDLMAGHIRRLQLSDAGRDLAPFHVAPWVDDPAIVGDESLPANLRHLSGDFFCAPFATSDVEEAPPHGWPANSAWDLVETRGIPGGVTSLYRLRRPVLGATVEKRFTLREGHPFLYQTHLFRGGEGALPVANHAMVALPDGGRLAFSPKQRIETPDVALEPDPARGRSRLAYPAATSDPTKVAMSDGTVANITRYPIASRHEDFVMMIESPGQALGWLAASRPAGRDAMLSLKNPKDYPVTFLWMSNGGRDYAPWNGRHVGVLGVEEGRSYSIYGHRASIEPNPLSDSGVPTALRLAPGGTAEVRNVIGAIALPDSGAAVAGIVDRGGSLLVSFEDGTERTVPFDSSFLSGA